MIGSVIAYVFWALASMPSFEGYPVPRETVEHPKIDLHSHPIGPKFRTTIRETVASEGANLAGHFTVVEWGCGTSCQQFAIVDLRTGRIFHNPNRILTRGLEYHVESSLVILNPWIPGELDFLPEVPTTYCRWDGTKLSKLLVVPHAR